MNEVMGDRVGIPPQAQGDDREVGKRKDQGGVGRGQQNEQGIPCRPVWVTQDAVPLTGLPGRRRPCRRIRRSLSNRGTHFRFPLAPLEERPSPFDVPLR